MSQAKKPREEPPIFQCGDHWHLPPINGMAWWLCNARVEDEPFRGTVHITSGYKNDPEPYTIHDWLACGYFTLIRDGEVLKCYAVDRRGEAKLFTERDVKLFKGVRVYADTKADIERMRAEYGEEAWEKRFWEKGIPYYSLL